LENALVIFSKKGQAGLGIQNMSTALGVSRGSFYWHFNNRDDFVQALLLHWYEEYSVVAPAAIDHDGGTAEEKLGRFMRLVHEKHLRRYDLILRSIALHDPLFARWVRKADRFRLKFTHNLFVEMGFSEREAQVRARTCLAYMTMEHNMFDKLGRSNRSGLIVDFHELLVKK
jgi:AcrR family transcriptional regulator